MNTKNKDTITLSTIQGNMVQISTATKQIVLVKQDKAVLSINPVQKVPVSKYT
jgi:hypothetical protein